MNLHDCYSEHQGTSVLVPSGGAGNDGQCVQWADLVLHDVYGFDYVYTPGAIDWWNNFSSIPQLAINFDQITDGSIKVGDFVIYDGRVGSVYGHIDVASRDGSVHDFWAYDSNWGGSPFKIDGYPVLHEVHHNDAYDNYILGSLRRKEDDMAEPIFNEGDRVNINNWLYGSDRGQHADQIGKTYKDGAAGVFLSDYFVQESRVNDGDVVNINNALGGEAVGQKGRIWKSVTYEYILPNIPKSQPPAAESPNTPSTDQTTAVNQVIKFIRTLLGIKD